MSSVTVAVRVRPFTDRELDDSGNRPTHNVIKVDASSGRVLVQDRNDIHSDMQFSFDHCFNSTCPDEIDFCDQQQLYESLCRPLLDKAFGGYNVCVFTYGQTGSGKSYTIMGTDKDNGVIPRFAKDLFLQAKQHGRVCFFETSFYEIYNEKIYDLLADKNGSERQTLRLREHPQTGPYVENLTTKTIDSIDEMFDLLVKGNKNRATAATSMNDRSSRSHAIFSIQLICQKTTNTLNNSASKKQNLQSLLSKINFVDLAGSERATLLQSTGDRLKEGNMINKSLLTLGKVITLLSEGDSNSFIPYRDSALTFLLKECLGGNSSTCMIATISPSAMNIEETLSTLRYASKARRIVNKIKNNVPPLSSPSAQEQLQWRQTCQVLRDLNEQVKVELDELRALNRTEYKNNNFLRKITNIFGPILEA